MHLFYFFLFYYCFTVTSTEGDRRLGLEAKTALLTEVGMNINYYINAKVYFKMACARVRV